MSDLEGYGLHNLIEIISPEIKPFDIALYENDIYWTDRQIPALIVAERYQGLYARIASPFIFRGASGFIIVPGMSYNKCLFKLQSNDSKYDTDARVYKTMVKTIAAILTYFQPSNWGATNSVALLQNLDQLNN